MTPARRRHIAPTDPGGEPVCVLTAEGARGRRVPIDRLLELGEMRASGNGYEIRLPAGDEHWTLANAFAEEEAGCCAAMAFEVTESDTAILLVATF